MANRDQAGARRRARHTALQATEKRSNERVVFMTLPSMAEICRQETLSIQTDPVKIGIRARKQDDRLVLEVANDGPALPEGWSMETHARVGLRNVLERLEILYDKKYEIGLYSIEPKGVMARLIIPYSLITNHEEPENGGISDH